MHNPLKVAKVVPEEIERRVLETATLLELEEGMENPLPSIPAFVEFQEKLKSWLVEPPVPEQLTIVGSYRSF